MLDISGIQQRMTKRCENVLVFCGHLSFAVMMLSWAVTDMLALRCTAMAGARSRAPLLSTRAFSSQTAEEDQGSQEKQIGNPIGWLNPLSGPDAATQEMGGPLGYIKWWWYPAGIGGCLVLALISRRRNMKKEQEQEQAQQLLGSPQLADLSKLRTS